MDITEHLPEIIEALLLAQDEALTIAKMKSTFPEDQVPSTAAMKSAIKTLQERTNNHGFEIQEVASGYRLQIRQDFAGFIAKLWEEKPPRYSRALLETIAIIAYRQPITRAEIEKIRGVAVSSHIVRTLLDREWVQVLGQRDVPGKPSIYGTTKPFLDYFNLKDLKDLPPIQDRVDIEQMANQLENDATEPLEITELLSAESDTLIELTEETYHEPENTTTEVATTTETDSETTHHSAELEAELEPA